MDIKEIYKTALPGTVFIGIHNEYAFPIKVAKPAQIVAHRLDGMLINLYDGSILHFSTFNELKEEE